MSLIFAEYPAELVPKVAGTTFGKGRAVNMKRIGLQHGAALLALCAALTGGAAGAQVLEAFDYAVTTPLIGKSGGTGWASAWASGNAQGSFTDSIAAGSLSYSTLVTSGNSYAFTSAAGGTFVDRERTATTAFTSGTVYMSFLARPSAAGGYFGFNFGTPGSSNAFVGGGNGFYGLGIAGGSSTNSTMPDTLNLTRLLVLRVDLGVGNDTVRLYIDPTVGGVEPVIANVTRTDFDLGSINRYTATFGQGAGGQLDELRSGRTFASVTPSAAVVVPEAGSASLLLCAAAGALGLVARRRSAR